MTSFRKFKSDEPLVWNYSDWYYSVEYYGITRNFIDIERLRECGDEIAERKRRPMSYTRPIWSKLGFVARLYNLRVRYIHFRHRNEIADLYKRAYAQFSSEVGDEET
jgi:hypothetical protein